MLFSFRGRAIPKEYINDLVDREAVVNGAAASGQPWQYYDLGHAFCTCSFFEQCPHRMACARCDFCLKTPARLNCWKQKTILSGCWLKFRSPMESALPLRMGLPPWTS